MSTLKEAVIVSAVRTPMGRGVKGVLKDTRPDTLAAIAITGALEAAKVDPALVEDVVLGCAMPEAEQGLNVARIAAFHAGLPDEAAAVTINRFCSSGVQAIAMAAERIMVGSIDVAVAGGTESMTIVPMGGHKYSVNPDLHDRRPETYVSMGVTAENVAKKYGVSREDQDAFALKSQQKAAAAMEAKRFDDELVPVKTRVFKDGEWHEITVDQ
ncbi:MAG: beta-ketoacyl synthase N-terminal-like domain-containing protein, partial [Deltaproteobacteria bacterium]|nr:beta-ketoacyl synthase N-terminal-like domain-containing protein [Deltaproteobacteria bacterium]